MKKINFNRDWRYYRKGEPDEAKEVHLPHDAMLEQKRIPRLKNGSFTGFFPSGDYSYEKNFYGEESYRDQSVILEFEGVYTESKVYLNGELLGGCNYGYSNFYIDLTDKIRIGEDNLLLVTVHCSQSPNARWYPGNGIYRPVNLFVGNRKHILLDGIFVRTLSINPAIVSVTTELDRNVGNADLSVEILYDGNVVATGKGTACQIEIPNAQLWDAENPNLYTARVSLMDGETCLDVQQTNFGIRTLAWNSTEGFLVNGNSIKLRGGCVHHDNGLLGACSFEEAEWRRIRILKEAGFNAIRSSHNPLCKSALDACDKLGMYVIDEAFDGWIENNGFYGYYLYFEEDWRKDVLAMIRKDRSHPCVVVYSTGNEVTDTVTPEGEKLANELADYFRELDPTRPTTQCPNLAMITITNKFGKPKISNVNPKREDIVDPLEEAPDDKFGGSVMINLLVAAAPAIGLMITAKNSDAATRGSYSAQDICGYNYGHKVYEKHHKFHPERVMLGTETVPSEIVKNWAKVEKNPYVIGDFMWTAWDYLGEAGAGAFDYGEAGGFMKEYPMISAYTGVVNLTGRRDTLSYLTEMVWGLRKEPYIAVRPLNHIHEKVKFSGYRSTDAIDSWSWAGYEGTKTEVQVYSPGKTVELLLNGKSLGKKALKNFVAKFKVAYYPGTLEAVSYDGQGRKLASYAIKSAKNDSMLLAIPEKTILKANGEDLAYINVSIADCDGIVKSLEDRKVTVTVAGAGVLQAVGSDDGRTPESYLTDSFTTYYGRMQAIVRSTEKIGDITVTISADGLETQIVTLQAN